MARERIVDKSCTSWAEGALTRRFSAALGRDPFGAALPPSQSERLAASLGRSLLDFIERGQVADWLGQGRALALAGVGHRGVVDAAEILRTLAESARPQDPDRTWSNLLLGYMQGREEALLGEQERTHPAHLRAARPEQPRGRNQEVVAASTRSREPLPEGGSS
ncbi:MAG: hypothetical protein HY901_15895 [Deltaproteobacteria bacterium]|nr:hypothetical protein [Deltaproteobacteria bacterium]